MAGSSLFALIDDIASILDDVSVMTKVATKKTAGVLGDDLALNAQQVSGVDAERELPVVWAVAKGSAINKLILVPAALLISVVAPGLIKPLLMVGGAFLCFEGVEKLFHKFLHAKEEDQKEHEKLVEALANPAVDMVAHEKEKIRGAVRTDFILSAEIITIALGTVAEASFGMKVAVLTAVAVIMNVGVYGLVAGIVKLDDGGLALTRRTGESSSARAQRAFGRAILAGAPWLMKTLSVLGTAAMFLVGGGIIAHNIGPLHHAVEHVMHSAEHLPAGGFMAGLSAALMNGLIGIVVGAIVLGGVSLVKRVVPKSTGPRQTAG